MAWFREKQNKTKSTKNIVLPYNLPQPPGLTLISPLTHTCTSSERKGEKPKSVYVSKNAKAVCNLDLITSSALSKPQTACVCEATPKKQWSESALLHVTARQLLLHERAKQCKSIKSTNWFHFWEPKKGHGEDSSKRTHLWALDITTSSRESCS